ncbi:DUF1775 domain-containing protein [Streptomyces virginiae]|uniref:DUF1775 domain-containing protein n=1 Tax=Streptomyces virginiae TaxID=1961 RepID=UPI0035DC094F
MQISHDHLPLRRLGLAAAGSVVLLGIAAGPAAAHAEVSASDPRALAENVTLSFTSEAESDAAGIAELRVVLPQGIAPDAVTLKEAPEGWKLTATPDGYSVGGAALATGTDADAEYSITVRQLPDAESLAFKTLETYGDGKVSRWIEVPADGRKVDNPAPLLKLQPAAPGAKPIAPSPSPTPTPTPSAPTAEPSSPAPAAAPDARKANAADSGSGNGVVVAVVAAVVVLGGAGAFRWTRRSRQS